MVKLSKPWAISVEYGQYLNVGWAEIVSVDHIAKFLHTIMMVRSCMEIWWWKEMKLESNLRKLITRRVLKGKKVEKPKLMCPGSIS